MKTTADSLTNPARRAKRFHRPAARPTAERDHAMRSTLTLKAYFLAESLLAHVCQWAGKRLARAHQRHQLIGIMDRAERREFLQLERDSVLARRASLKDRRRMARFNEATGGSARSLDHAVDSYLRSVGA